MVGIVRGTGICLGGFFINGLCDKDKGKYKKVLPRVA